MTGRDAFISLLAIHYANNLKYHSTHMSMSYFGSDAKKEIMCI